MNAGINATSSTGRRLWTDRRIKVLRMVAAGNTFTEIDRQLGHDPDACRQGSPRYRRQWSVRAMAEIRQILGVLTNEQAVVRAIDLGVLPTNRLTAKQAEALELLADGCTQQQAARRMGISITDYKERLRLARQKLGARTPAEAVTIAYRRGLIRTNPPDTTEVAA